MHAIRWFKTLLHQHFILTCNGDRTYRTTRMYQEGFMMDSWTADVLLLWHDVMNDVRCGIGDGLWMDNVDEKLKCERECMTMSSVGTNEELHTRISNKIWTIQYFKYDWIYFSLRVCSVLHPRNRPGRNDRHRSFYWFNTVVEPRQGSNLLDRFPCCLA